MLHDAFQLASPGSGGTSGPVESSDQKVGATSYARGGAQTLAKIALPVVAVMVKGDGQEGWLKTYALLDPGSNRSFCSMELVKMLNMHGSPQSMSLNTLSSSSPVETLMVSVDITGVAKTQRSKPLHLPNVYALKDFPVLRDSLATYEEVQKFEHLKGVTVPQVSKEGVMLLIGQDALHVLTPLEVKHGKQGEPYAEKTVLGWTINGPLTDGTLPQVTSHFVQGSLDAQVERYWKLDVGDTLSSNSPSLSVSDKRAVKIWDDSVQVNDGHYELAIPFKTDDPHFPDNKSMAEKRLVLLGKRLTKDPNLHDRYTTEISTRLDRGYAEKVPDERLDDLPGKTWYLLITAC